MASDNNTNPLAELSLQLRVQHQVVQAARGHGT
jgi:hypothetical protein